MEKGKCEIAARISGEIHPAGIYERYFPAGNSRDIREYHRVPRKSQTTAFSVLK